MIGKKYQVMKKTKDRSVLGEPTDEVPPEIAELPVDQMFIKKWDDPDHPFLNLKVSQLNKLKDSFLKVTIPAEENELKEIETQRDRKLKPVGNIVHSKCVVSKNEDNNGLVRTWGEPKEAKWNHVDLMEMLEGIDTIKGAKVAGSRGYFVLGDLVRLNYALVCYGLDFLKKKGHKAIYTPFFMKQEMMERVAQLEQFDEELYKVTGEGEEKVRYLIATSEQPICGYHLKGWYEEKDLPIKYAGMSTNFRKEAGSHGRDTLGIFRVHQFEKIEQFCVTSPKNDASWKMFDQMIGNAEDFWKSLKIPYRVVNIVSGKLNNAAALKYDLEGWFPASKTYRELVSCSNCTDYQSRALETRFGKRGKKGGEKEYVHMLNATLCATTRGLCCIAENYQTEEGIGVPDVLRPYMGGQEMIPFVHKAGPPKRKKK